MRTPPLLADFTHTRACKPFCEKYLTLPKDCRDIMEVFTVRKYGTSPKPYEKLAEEISRRVGELRNNLAHDKLDWSFEAIQISDIKVVEELLYAIRLKQIGLERDKIQKAMKKLFQEI